MSKRTADFEKDPVYEALLEEANVAVEGWGEEERMPPARPVLFVVGAPRSGTTLLYQLLAATGGFHYPTNLVARFYRSPAWGARTQRLLQPLLHRGTMRFTSRAGNTEDWWGPHEFGYFWEWHFRFRGHHEPQNPDLAPMARALGAFEAQDPRPLLFKSNILCLVVEHLARVLPTARFLWIHRPLLAVADSIYRTRLEYSGDARVWWSLRPADAREDIPAARQIAHQISRTVTALSRARDALGSRFSELNYGDVCRESKVAVKAAEDLIGAPLDRGHLPGAFPTPDSRCDPSVRDDLREALEAEDL